jgi:hydroxymethylpyrimidine/phosphomethylpyrimidine kinase
MHQSRPYCLSIAGFDPSGGAGILADIKTFEQIGAYGLGIVSALTFQNDSTFKGLEWSSLEVIENQMSALQKYPVKVVKIGLIESIETLQSVITIAEKYFNKPKIIWDPIMKATAGFNFHNKIKLNSFLTERITLITPNKAEYSKIDSEQLNNVAVLIKGGHSKERGTDILKLDKEAIEIVGEPFEKTIDKHGTGCVLSSAIASFLAKSYPLVESCREAKKYTERFILSNSLNLGYHS